MSKYDFIKWEESHNYDLNYSYMDSLILFEDIPANNDIYSTVGRVIRDIAEDEGIVDIRAHWYNNEYILIIGNRDEYGSFTLEGCIYIH